MSMLGKFEELVVEWAIQSLRNDPSEWKADSYRITHTSGTSIWIGNGWWGVYISDKAIKVEYKGSGSYHDKYKRRYPTILERVGVRANRGEDWRSRVWTAYEEWMDRHGTEAIKEWLKSR